MKILYGFQCPKCFIRSGTASTNTGDAPLCCGGITMVPYEIIAAIPDAGEGKGENMKMLSFEWQCECGAKYDDVYAESVFPQECGCGKTHFFVDVLAAQVSPWTPTKRIIAWLRQEIVSLEVWTDYLNSVSRQKANTFYSGKRVAYQEVLSRLSPATPNDWVSVEARCPRAGEYVIGATPIDDDCWHIQIGRFRPPEDHGGIAVIETGNKGWSPISHWMPRPTPPAALGLTKNDTIEDNEVYAYG